MPTVSVIIPTFNYGQFIGDALASVFAQTYEDFEVIVVDDGSTDDTKDRLKPFSSRVRYIFQPHAGAGAARNAGIQASRGKYLAFLDADDTWLPERLARQVELLDRIPEVSVVYTWWVCVDEKGRRLTQTTKPTYQGDVSEVMLTGCFVTLSLCMVRATCFDRVGPLDPTLRSMEDWDILLRCARAGYRFAYVPAILMQHRLHLNSRSGDLSVHWASHLRVAEKAFSQLPATPRVEELRKVTFRTIFVSMAMEYFSAGRQEEGSRFLATGVQLEPGQLQRPGFFLTLALRLLPFGSQTWVELRPQVDAVAARLTDIFASLFQRADLPESILRRKRAAWSNLLIAFAVLYGRSGRWDRAGYYLGKAFVISPFGLTGTILHRTARIPSAIVFKVVAKLRSPRGARVSSLFARH